jgi:N-acetylglucosamine kinase-like BadF-type ATPase
MIVVESGGTKSTWMFRDESGNKLRFELPGLHPQEISNAKKEEVYSLIEQYKLHGKSLYFFGAGCESTSGQNVIKEFLTEMNLNPFTVQSDVVGACIAILGDQPGVVGILGTGAVVAQYDGRKVTKMASGRGFILGDEGSGFDIGKHIIIARLEGQLDADIELVKAIDNYFGGKYNIIHSCSAFDSRFKIAGLVKVIARFIDNKFIFKIIKDRIEVFYEKGVGELQVSGSIGLVGSVAFYFQNEISHILSNKGVTLSRVEREAVSAVFDFIER